MLEGQPKQFEQPVEWCVHPQALSSSVLLELPEEPDDN
jgi:hypothetical protein